MGAGDDELTDLLLSRMFFALPKPWLFGARF